MAQKYYNTAETAQVLGKSVDDVRQMMERHELHGYRDGADWKFKVEDIDQLAKQMPAQPAEQDVGDVLLSEVELGQSDPGLSGTVIGISGIGAIATESDIRLVDSDIRLASSDIQLAGSDIQLAGSDVQIVGSAPAPKSDLRLADSDIALGALGADSEIPASKPKARSDVKPGKFEELNLTLDEDLTLDDSSVAIDAKSGGSSVVDLSGKELEDDDLVLGGSSGAGSGVGSDVSIGGDSGISLVDPSDSGLSLETPINLGPVADESLELGEDDMLGAADVAGEATPRPFKADDEFQLTPMEMTDADESESASQVIALDMEADEAATMIGAGPGVSMASMLEEDLSTQPSLGMGAGAPLAPSPAFGVAPAGLAEGAPMIPSAGLAEAPYTTWQIVGLSACTVLLMFCGMMMYDLMRNMWSWQGAFTVNSGIMDTILGWIGL